MIFNTVTAKSNISTSNPRGTIEFRRGRVGGNQGAVQLLGYSPFQPHSPVSSYVYEVNESSGLETTSLCSMDYT